VRHHRYFATAAMAVALAAAMAACGSSSTTTSPSSTGMPKTGNLTVWMMAGDAPVALTGSGTGKSCNSTAGSGATVTGQWVSGFEHLYPGWTVTVTCQVWGNQPTQELDAMGSSNPPDVIDMGNTYVPGFAAAGGLLDVGSYTFPNESTWLTGLKESSTYNNTLYAVPLLAGDRDVVYNTAMFKAAGITTPPTTISQLLTDGEMLDSTFSSTKGYCALYLGGEDWYQIFGFLASADAGTASAADPIATYSDGTWTPTLGSSSNQAELATIKSLYDKISTCAPPDAQSTDFTTALEDGTSAMAIESSWELGVVQGAAKAPYNSASDWSVFAQPGVSGPAPVFLGGSDIGVAERAPSGDQAAAIKFIQYITDTAELTTWESDAPGTIPNTTSLFSTAEAGNAANEVAIGAASNSWFTPESPGEATAESDNIYTDMLGSIMTGDESVAAATSTADTALQTALNPNG
jgi:N,N'-diacetylchitobiose transport system substrate-binding protein